MLALLGDTHGTDGHRLEGRTREAVRTADRVCHLGDFTTDAVYEALAAASGADTDDGTAPLTAVAGNNESPALSDRLPETATVEYEGATIVLAHGHRRDRTGLGLLAREAAADVIAVGHSHRPGIDRLDGRLLLNPGSHADPRRYRPGHAELGDGTVTIYTPSGERLASTRL